MNKIYQETTRTRRALAVNQQKQINAAVSDNVQIIINTRDSYRVKQAGVRYWETHGKN